MFRKFSWNIFFSAKMNFSPLVTPYDPVSKSETIRFVEGPKLADIHLSRGPATYHVGGVALSV